MGFFSFMTTDTNKSIPNIWSNRRPFTVHMVDDKGNVWTEDNYDGYGKFGGKDYYILVAEMNGFIDESDEEKRTLGIEMFCDVTSRENMKSDHRIFPSLLSEDNNFWWDTLPQDCEFQGYFYPSDDETVDTTELEEFMAYWQNRGFEEIVSFLYEMDEKRLNDVIDVAESIEIDEDKIFFVNSIVYRDGFAPIHLLKVLRIVGRELMKI